MYDDANTTTGTFGTYTHNNTDIGEAASQLAPLDLLVENQPYYFVCTHHHMAKTKAGDPMLVIGASLLGTVTNKADPEAGLRANNGPYTEVEVLTVFDTADTDKLNWRRRDLKAALGFEGDPTLLDAGAGAEHISLVGKKFVASFKWSADKSRRYWNLMGKDSGRAMDSGELSTLRSKLNEAFARADAKAADKTPAGKAKPAIKKGHAEKVVPF